MSILDYLLLVVAGFGAGLIGYVTGLASVVSYPALLAVGLPPIAANVTNTVALVSVGIGSLGQSGRILLDGDRRRLVGGGVAALRRSRRERDRGIRRTPETVGAVRSRRFRGRRRHGS